MREILVMSKCTAEVWSDITPLEDKEYIPGDLIPILSSEVEGDDVVVITDDGLTLIFPTDCVSVRLVKEPRYNRGMKKILVIDLYDGSNEVDEVSEKMMEQIKKFCVRGEGDKVIWKCEEFMYVEL